MYQGWQVVSRLAQDETQNWSRNLARLEVQDLQDSKIGKNHASWKVSRRKQSHPSPGRFFVTAKELCWVKIMLCQSLYNLSTQSHTKITLLCGKFVNFIQCKAQFSWSRKSRKSRETLNFSLAVSQDLKNARL